MDDVFETTHNYMKKREAKCASWPSRCLYIELMLMVNSAAMLPSARPVCMGHDELDPAFALQSCLGNERLTSCVLATDRLKAREEDQKYSKAQTAARRRAAVELEKQAAGPWWSRVGAAFGLDNLTAMANRSVAVNCWASPESGRPQVSCRSHT